MNFSMTFQFGGAALYVGSAFAYLTYLTLPRRTLGHIATGGLIAGVLGHVICFVARALGGGLPLTSTGVILSAIAMTVALVWLVAQFFTRAVIVGAFVSPIAAVFAILAAAVPSGEHAIETAPQGLLVAHLSMVYLGLAVFALAGCVGVVYLLQERQLKRKTLGKLFRRLPALDVLDRVGYRSQAAGFILLTLALITGAVIAAVTGKAMMFHARGEVLATILVWGFYAAALQTRLFIGWRGAKGAWFAVTGFFLINLVFLVVRVFAPVT